MPEREGFPPPEALITPDENGTHPEEAHPRALESLTENTAGPEPSQPDDRTSYDSPPQMQEEDPGESRPEDEWDKEGKRAEVVQEFTRGLGDLHELLPRSGPITKQDVLDLIDHTELRALWPRPRKDLADIVTSERLNEGAKAAFLLRGLDVLRDVIDMEVLKRAGDEWLDQRLAGRDAETKPLPH